MPHNIFKDIECNKMTVKDSETHDGAVSFGSTVTVTGAAALNGGTTTTTLTTTEAVSFGLGQTTRVFPVPNTKDDVGTAGTLVESFFILPKRSKLVKFGIMSAASDIICSTTTSFELRTVKGTKVYTFTTGSLVLGTGDATGAVGAATYLKRNKPYVGCVGTDVGDSGSFYYFIDVKPVGA